MRNLVRCGLLAAALLTAQSARAQITLELPATALTSPPVAVHLAGSFNHWSTTATLMLPEGGSWRAELTLPDGRHYYK